MIRRATLADVPTLLKMARSMHRESATHSRLGFNERKVAQMLTTLIGRPLRALVIVSETAGAIDGAALAHVDEHFFSDDLVAQELAVYVVPEKRGSLRAARLVAAIDAWARAMGAKLLQAGCTTGVALERTINLYEHLGFTRTAIGVERVYH